MYASTPPAQFALGGLIVVLPAALITDEDWAWRYTILILTMYTVYNWRGLTRFASWAGAALRSR